MKVHWQDGLHQFLQMKEGLLVSNEGMTSNFISNIAHFNRYPALYGLTGTLGSEQSKMYLHKAYRVQMVAVPPFKKRRLEVWPGEVVLGEGEWSAQIVSELTKMNSQGRSTLVIFETIKQLDRVFMALEDGEETHLFKRIQSLKTGEEVISDRVDCQ